MSVVKNYPRMSLCTLGGRRGGVDTTGLRLLAGKAGVVQSATQYSGPEDRSAVFHQALTFVRRFSEDARLRRKIKQEMDLIDEDQQLVVEVITPPVGSANSPTSFAGTVPANQGFGALCLEKEDEFLGQASESIPEVTLETRHKKETRLVKKTSIFSGDSSEAGDSEGWGDESDEMDVLSLEFPEFEMDESTFEALFEEIDPFLITLSLCLWVRWELSCGQEWQGQEGWSLCVATMLAYKVAFDDTLSGILEYYGELMGVDKGQMMQLEKCFLEQIDYNTVVRNYQYHLVLSQLLSP